MISGSTRLIGFIGDPIQQAKSPEKLNAIFDRAGVDTVCVPMHVRQGDLPAFLNGMAGLRNLDGIIATIPHKFDLAALADDLEENAAFVGAANVAKRTDGGRWTAELFDGIGFVQGLEKRGHDLRGKSILLTGAGGAGTAIAGALAKAHTGPLTIVDADEARAAKLAGRLREKAPEMAVTVAPLGADPAGFDVVVNATPMGMGEGDPLPVDPTRLDPASLVVDIIMKPEKTRLLIEAEKQGCRIHPGRHMLDSQLDNFLAFFGHGDLTA